jgi:hypothetical protein
VLGFCPGAESPGTLLPVPLLLPGDTDVLIGIRHFHALEELVGHVDWFRRSLFLSHFRL